MQGAERVVLFYGQLEEKVRALPGVQSVTVSTGVPLQGGFGMAFDIVGRPEAQGSARDTAGFIMATPDYFRTYGLPILQGRGFTRAGHARAARASRSSTSPS